MDFPFKVKPFAHQLKEFKDGCSEEGRGLFWEPGCGKSAPVLDQAAALYLGDEIEGLFILAPNGAHTNWVRDLIPTHLADVVAEKARVLHWRTNKTGTRWFQQEANEFLAYRDGLTILVMSMNALRTKVGGEFVKRYITSRRCMGITDELHHIKTPGSKRTIRVLAMGKYLPYRRGLTGSIVDDKPFDVYAPVKFINPAAWRPLGIQDAAAFRAYFGVWEKGYNSSTRKEYDQLVTYCNLDDMHEVIRSVGTLLFKKDVLDLPPKLYSTHYFEISPAQRRIYNDLRREFITEVPQGGTLTADLAIVRMTRFQQIVSGYVPSDREEELKPIDESPPRIRALLDCVEGVEGKAIIWGKYDVDVDLVAKALRAEGHETVTYDGRTSDDDRDTAKERFQNGDARFFVGKPSCAGESLTLHAATTVIYYNNGFHLRPRLQSEDRAHRIGQKHPVRYIDLTASDTIDERIVASLRMKKAMAHKVTGADLEKWI